MGEQVARFAQEWIIQTKGRWAGKPLHLEPWERAFLDELFLVYDDGERVYREGLLGVARKNGKSTMSAAFALYMLVADGEQGPEVYAAAASKDQARIVFNQAKAFVEASPKLRDWLKVSKDVISCKANDGVFRVLSSDAPMQYGLNPSAVIIDELWAHANDGLYYALTTAQGARENPLTLSLTTAGWDRLSVCYGLYERGRALEREGGLDQMRREAFYFRWYEASAEASVRDLAGWEAANPSSWIREEDIERESYRLPESVFRRLHLNQWVEQESSWIKPHEWDACQGKPIFNPRMPSYIGVDVGVRRDSAAIVWGQWHGDKLHVGQLILSPEEEGETFGVADVRGALVNEAKRHQVLREVPYDPWSFRESAEILLEAGLPMAELPQNASRLSPASETIYELITERRLVHDGNRIMRGHVLSAVTAPTDRGGWRISKRKSQERIDGAMSLTMMADRATVLRNYRPPGRRAAFL